MSYSIEHNILDPNLYVKHQGLPHELYDLWREQDPVHWNPPTSDYEAPGSDSVSYTHLTLPTILLV